ncbi:MAG: hypothetical protein JW963_22885 [Anaerolineales bacterium]|nr:hypothetical protein [Anaerolineales bacterium]
MQKSISIKEIGASLGLDTPREDREKIIRNIINLYKNDTMFGTSGKCSNISPIVYPDHYFLAQRFDGKKEDMRKALQEAFAKFNLKVFTVDREIGGFLLCNIAALIMGTAFGVYHISKEQKPNIYIELGISIGLRKPFVLVKDRDADIANILIFVHYYEMNNYFSLSEEFGDLTNDYITRIGYVDDALIPKVSSETQEVCISLGSLEVVDVGLTLAKLVTKYGYQPVFLGATDKTLIRFLEQNGIKPIFYQTLQENASAIASSKFGIYRIDTSALSSSFVNLGIAIGLNRPTYMINNVREEPPSDLSIFQSLKYEGITELDEVFSSDFPTWKERSIRTT